MTEKNSLYKPFTTTTLQITTNLSAPITLPNGKINSSLNQHLNLLPLMVGSSLASILLFVLLATLLYCSYQTRNRERKEHQQQVELHQYQFQQLQKRLDTMESDQLEEQQYSTISYRPPTTISSSADVTEGYVTMTPAVVSNESGTSARNPEVTGM